MVICAGFASLGILIDAAWFDSLASSGWKWALIASVFLVAIEAFRWIRRRGSGRPSRIDSIGLWVTTAVLLTSVFGLWHARSEHKYRSAILLDWLAQNATPQPVVVRGTLRRPVSLRANPLAASYRQDQVSPWQSQLEVALDQIRGGDRFDGFDGNVLVYVEGDQSHLRTGDRLEIYGWMEGFAGPSNPGQPDLRPVYRRRQLHGRIETKNATAITCLNRSAWTPQSMVASIATAGRQSLFRHTDDRTGPLAVALVLGQREFVDPDTRDALLATGTAHLLSVSGMHLAILVLVATWLLTALGLRPFSRLGFIIAISVLYVAVTGARPPVVRAAILISTLLISTCFYRTSQPLNTLAVAAMGLLVINPVNVFAVGVHLSFLAVITLMLAGRPVAPGSMTAELQWQREMGFQALVDQASGRWMRHAKTGVRFIAQMAWLSACVSAVSLPLVWSQFHLISLVSVVTNVLVWAGLMVALPAGVLTVMLDSVHPILATVPGGLCHGALQYMWAVIDWTQRWPGGHFWLPSPPTGWVVAFYVVLAATLLWSSGKGKTARVAWILIWSIVAFWLATRPADLPEDTVEATFIDVGHGTSVILRMPDQKVYLYDCGRLGNYRWTSRDIDTALWSLGITHLDAVFLSHADADHYNALPALLKRFSIETILVPPGLLDGREPGLRELRLAIDASGVSVQPCFRGDFLGGDSTRRWAHTPITVLHPPAAGVDGSDNANSLVLQIDAGEHPLVLPGDLEPPGTEVVTEGRRPRAGGVLMAPHHGSLSMDAKTVLNWARPSETIVSGGQRAARMEVERMLSQTGSGVHVTAREGAVRVRISGKMGIQVRRWVQRSW